MTHVDFVDYAVGHLASRRKREIVTGRKYCYYCRAVVTDAYENDHFPVPMEKGGKQTVIACLPCHDMKDRIPFEQWNWAWWGRVREDFEVLPRELKIFIAKIIASRAPVEPDSGGAP